MPAKYAGHDHSAASQTALAAFALLVSLGAGLVTFRRLRG